jgi:hypothetical protein
VFLALIFPAAGAADSGDDDEARVRVACAGGTAELRVKAETDDDGAMLRIELRVETRRPIRSWRVVLLHERLLVLDRVRRPDSSSHQLRIRFGLRDWPGRETVTARVTARLATGNARTCRLQVTI